MIFCSTFCSIKSFAKTLKYRKIGLLSDFMVRERGLEPPRLAAPDPKSGASASSATPA